MNKILVLFLLVVSGCVYSGTPGIKFGLHFDEKGNVIRPDEVFLGRGLSDEKAGFKDQAMKNFKESASFGNAYAKYFLGLLYLQKNDYLNGHAWLSLLDSEFKGAEKVNSLLPRVKANLDESQIELADKKLEELKETYGEYAALMKREKWRKSHKYTGSHIKGHVPNNLRIEVGNGMSVTGHSIRKQIESLLNLEK